MFDLLESLAFMRLGYVICNESVGIMFIWNVKENGNYLDYLDNEIIHMSNLRNSTNTQQLFPVLLLLDKEIISMIPI